MAKNNEQSLHDLLKNVFGFEQFKGNQEDIIKSILAGNNTFVLMPTGGGKSLCYQLPALISEGTTIVVSPLIALMKNQVDMIRNFGTDSGIAHVMNSSLSKAELLQVKEDLTKGKTKLLYVAPESLTKEETVEFLRGLKISFFAIDEAHCISEWGHDFRPEYRRLRPIINAICPKLPVIALTATATVKVQKDIMKNLEMQDAKVFKSSFDRSNLYYEVRPKTKDVVKDIIKYIKSNPGKSGIVYCLSRKKVEELAEVLVANGIRALPYHAGLDSQTRRENQDKFLMEEADIIVATIAFGMGIDKPDIRFVIHHDIPKSLEGYYQETGRAGRDGGEGKCIAFYDYEDIHKLEKFNKGKDVAEQEIARELLINSCYTISVNLTKRKTAALATTASIQKYASTVKRTLNSLSRQSYQQSNYSRQNISQNLSLVKQLATSSLQNTIATNTSALATIMMKNTGHQSSVRQSSTVCYLKILKNMACLKSLKKVRTSSRNLIQ